MRLTEVLKKEWIKVPLDASDKQAAIEELVDLLAADGVIADAQAMKTAVWRREQTRSTGIGHGVAIPHGKCVGVKQLFVAIGRTAKPIDYASVDGKPVDLIFLLGSPTDQTGPHIQALASISRFLTDPELRRAVRIARNAGEVFQIVVDHEARLAV